MEGFMYILSNRNRSVLYVGDTKKIKNRIELHMAGKATEFTKKYNVNELMYFEKYNNHHDAFAR